MAAPGAVVDPSAVAAGGVVLGAADGHDLPVHVAAPTSGGVAAALVVIHAAFGVTDHIRDVCARFAAQGFVAAAPDLYARVPGGPPRAGEGRDGILGRLEAMGDDGALDDLQTTATWLRADARCNGAVACIGFCMGGRLALLLAAEPRAVDRAIDCWGGRITRRTATVDARHPIVAIDRVADIHVPVLGVFGVEDDNPSPADVHELRAALVEAGVEHRIVCYEGAGHALFADNQPSYREAPAHLAWHEFLQFLAPLRGGAR